MAKNDVVMKRSRDRRRWRRLLAAAILGTPWPGDLPAVGQTAGDAAPLVNPADPLPEQLPPAEAIPAPGLTVESLERMALAANPAIAQTAAQIEALRGQWVQAGLPPNPSAGYTASEIGNDRRGGQQGAFASQEFVRGGKLDLNRVIVDRQIQAAQQRLRAMQLRVRTDVRLACYAALIAQRRLALADELLDLSGQAVEASRGLLQAREIPLAGLLQTEVEQQNAEVLRIRAENELAAAWRRLSAAVGCDVPLQTIAGDVTALPATLDWDAELARITETSPELGAAMIDVRQKQTALARARVEPTPNLLTQTTVQYDDSTNLTVVGLQAGVALPIWNRNQGGVREAQAEVVAARRNADRIELDLKQRLAEAFQRYSTARVQADAYATKILPKSRQTFELVQQGYQGGEVGYLDVLNAERSYSQTHLAYLDALDALWESWVQIDGLLLSGSLEARGE